MYTNTRSINNKHKKDEIQILLHQQNIDILGITESWMTKHIQDAEISFKGYKIYRRDRIDQRGGGILLYVSNKLDSYQLEEDNISESMWIKIKGQFPHEIIIGICYRSQLATKVEEMNLLRLIKHYSNKSLIVIGDFNYRDIHWPTLQTKGEGQELLDLLDESFLFQHVDKPTRGRNILDLIISTEEDMIDNFYTSNPIANSDHNVLNWTIIHDMKKVLSEPRRNYNKGDYKGLNQCLNKEKWDIIFKDIQVEQMWQYLIQKINECQEEFIPYFKDYGKASPPWLNKKITKIIKTRNKQWKIFQKYPSYLNESKYKRIRNKVTTEIRRSKCRFESKIADKIKVNPKIFFSYVRSKNRSKTTVGPINNENNILISDSGTVASMLNTFFASTFTHENISNIPDIIYHPIVLEQNLKCNSIEFNESNVSKALSLLKDNKTGGVDKLNSTFLKNSSMSLTYPILLIFKASLITSKIPNDWKKANISPIFKKGSKKDVSNYRPISLTSHISKIMERIIKVNIVNFLESNHLLEDSQHGFRNKRSCLTNLLQFLETVGNNVDDGNPVNVIYLDFKKAFDTVPHKRLIIKLQNLGICGDLLNWIKEWLSDRQQRVVINGVTSEWVNVLSGVPQGSVLGPILFIIYINDLDCDIANDIFKFADDTKLLGKVGNDELLGKLQADLERIILWSEKWQMEFNENKCKIMYIGKNNKKEPLFLGQNLLVHTREEKDLGIMISDDLKVQSQCIKAANTGNKILGMIYRTFTNKTKNIMLQLYKSLVRPHLDYCSQAWNPHFKKDSDLLERVQRRATRMITECQGLPYQERLNILRLMTLEKRRLRADLLEVYKILNKHDDVRQDVFFVRQTNLHRQTTRGHNFKLFKKRFQIDSTKYSFGNRIVNSWNKLPSEVVNARTPLTFKIQLDNYLRNTEDP